MTPLIRTTYLTFIYILLYLPIGVLITYSFNDARFSLLWHHFSLNWYRELLHDHDLWIAFFHSLILGVTSSLTACIMGFFSCSHLFLTHRGKAGFIQHVLLLLIIIPDLIFGVALLVFFNLINIPPGFLSLFIAHVTFCLPFVMITIKGRMETLDINLFYSAVDLGASYHKTLTRIILPLLWPAILSAFLLGFTLSLDDVMISYFVAGPEFNILPLTIYSLVRAGVTPELNALCSLTFLLSMTTVLVAHAISRKKP